MRNEEQNPSGLLNSAQELRQLILDNPDLPLLVFAGEDSNSGDYSYMSCSSVKAEVGVFLDCSQTINDERCYTDESDFAEDVESHYYGNFDGSDAEFETFVENEILKYEPYWKKCIIVRVNN